MAGNKTENDGSFLVLICLVGLLVAFGLFWARFEEPVVRAVLELGRLFMTPLGLVSARYEYAAKALAHLDPATRDISFALAVLSKALFPYVLFLCLPLLALLVARGWRVNVQDVHRRTLGIRELLENGRQFSPCIEPILNWPRSLLDEPIDSGPWMAARQPLQLAAEEGLLVRKVDNRGMIVPKDELLTPDGLAQGDSPWLGRPHNGLCLDREAASACYMARMGPKWEGFDRLSPVVRKLAFAFALYACDGKEKAQGLLDELSISFRVIENTPHDRPDAPEARGTKGARRSKRTKGTTDTTRKEGVPTGRPVFVLDTHVDTALLPDIEQALNSPQVTRAVQRHGSWTNMVVLALYEAARRKGVLPTAEFIWLKPVNRTLFYLLNNVGRRTAWPEIAGPWAHYEAEKRFAKIDPKAMGIATPQVQEGVNALEVALYEEGWISPDMLSPAVLSNKRTLGID